MSFEFDSNGPMVSIGSTLLYKENGLTRDNPIAFKNVYVDEGSQSCTPNFSVPDS